MPTDRPTLAPSERGVILAQAAILMIPLIIFAAFATDIGSWYLVGQKVQRSTDAAALAGVTALPNVDEAERLAREAAAANGYVDATPGDNTDFDTGPLPQIRVTTIGSQRLEVEIKTAATSFFGKVVLDSVEIHRRSLAEFVQDVHLGNPTSGLGTGDLPTAALGLPSDRVWLSVNAYCSDHEQGDHFAVGFYDGPTTHNGNRTCGPAAGSVFPVAQPNPTFDPDAYVFVVEYQAGSPAVDIDVYEPGTGCSDAGSTGDGVWGPVLNFEIYGPNDSRDHRAFVDTNAPISTTSLPWNACVANAPGGDGWWPLLDGAATPSAGGGFYYVKVTNRHPGSADAFPGDPFWNEFQHNNFSLRATRSGETQLCAFSTADPTCPQVYALQWLPLFRQIPSDEAPFFLAEIDESYAGDTLVVSFFDAAEGIDNLQFVDANDQAMPFEWRYVDTSTGQLPGVEYLQTDPAPHSDTCTWQGAGGNPCLDTSTRSDWNDHFVEIRIDIPATYTCGADCWWRVRYVTSGTPTDRSGWSIVLQGDPVRLLE